MAGLAYLFAAVWILGRGASPASIGRRLARFALVLYAVDQFAYFSLTFLLGSRQEHLRTLLAAFDVVATAVIGLALVAWLLEGEREKQVQAADLARRRERAQACAYRISEAARTVWDLPGALPLDPREPGRGPPREQLLHRAARPRVGPAGLPLLRRRARHDAAPKPPGRGLTEYVLRTGQPLLATPEVFRGLVDRGEVELIASDSVDWLGAPLARARRDDRGGGGPDLRPRGPPGAGGARPLRLRLRPDRRGDRGEAAEDALRQSEARLRVAIGQVPAVLWTTDEELRFTSSLGAGLSALGLAPNQVVGLSLEQYLGAGSVALDRHRAGPARRVGGLRVRDGGALLHRSTWSLCATAEGAIRGTVGIAVDITEVRRADRALRDSEARLRQVIDLVPHFIFAKDGEGRFLLANRAVAEAYGTAVDRLIGRTDEDFARSGEEVRRFREDDLEVMRTGSPKVVLEEPITDSRGRVRYLQTTKIPFTFSGTGRPAILGVSIDITERKAAEEALRRAAKEESLTVLAGGVAHDFNNLLAAILGHASLALKQLPEGAPARRHVEKAAGAVERAADLTRQMLAYSGRGHFVVRPTDVNALVRENLPLLEVGVPKSVRLVATLEDDLPAGGRRRGPAPAGADEPRHQRGGGHRRARGHGDPGDGRSAA